MSVETSSRYGVSSMVIELSLSLHGGEGREGDKDVVFVCVGLGKRIKNNCCLQERNELDRQDCPRQGRRQSTDAWLDSN